MPEVKAWNDAPVLCGSSSPQGARGPDAGHQRATDAAEIEHVGERVHLREVNRIIRANDDYMRRMEQESTRI